MNHLLKMSEDKEASSTSCMLHRNILRVVFFFLFLIGLRVLFIYLFIIHLFTSAYIVWVISPPNLLPRPTHLQTPHFQVEPVLPLSLILLKRRHKHNKKDKVFLLIELKIAIQRDS
jgi:hypothetical protein